jgi:hypothetical protein
MSWTAITPRELLMYCVKRVEVPLSNGKLSVGTGYICAVGQPNGQAVNLQTRFALLGTLWGGPRISEHGEIKIAPVPTNANLAVETGVRMHLGYAIKASETSRLLKAVAEKYGSVGSSEFIYPEMMVPLTPEALYKAIGIKVQLP